MDKPFQLVELEKIPLDKWPKIYCLLNGWQIPEELIHIKPIWWDKDIDAKNKRQFIRPMFDKIKETIDDKILSREWNKETMTDEQFELWWLHKDDEDYMEKWFPKIHPDLFKEKSL